MEEKEKNELIYACIRLLGVTRQDIPATLADEIVAVVEDILYVANKK